MSPWLRGELVLLLDENNQTELNDYRLFYSFEKGLEYERKEDGTVFGAKRGFSNRGIHIRT